jgi:hypothetical protein
MSKVVGLPCLWKDEDAKLRVCMEYEDGTPILELGSGHVSVQYAGPSDSALQTLDLSEAWSEIGHGIYTVLVDKTVLDEEGPFSLIAQILATGGDPFVALTNVEEGQYEAFASASYDQENGILTVAAWLQHRGHVITDPTACRVTVREDGEDTVADLIGSGADLKTGGFFIKTLTPFTLNPNKTNTVRIEITYQGVVYASGEAWISFN